MSASLAPTTIDTRFTIVRGVFRAAVADRLIPSDPTIGVVLHELRHCFASGLIAAGCDVVTVQPAMGHAAAATTLSTYAHLWPTAEDKTRAAASGMAAAVLASQTRSADSQS